VSAGRFAAARRVIAGGVNSPARAFRAVGGDPVFAASAAGCRVSDPDGRTYIDYIGSWGPMIAGHAHPAVLAGIAETAALGTSFGMPTEIETALAEEVTRAFPSVERVRFVSTGTEATMSAVRLARGATGRPLVVKMDGCYHGHGDALLVAAGSGPATLGIPGAPGVPVEVAALTRSIPFNDAGALETLCAREGDRIACVILEPVAGNMGVVPPGPGYLETVRALTRRHGIVWICDEVMTGFRVAYGGACERYRLEPDLVTLGKIVGGGLPAAAYGGGAGLMSHLAPDGPVYQAGTLSGNPLAMRAGLETLRILRGGGASPDGAAYARLESLASRLETGLALAADRARVPARINRAGSMLTLFFAREPVTDFASAQKADAARFAAFFQGMREEGILIPPSQFEALFIGLAHGEAEIDATIAAAERTLARFSS